MDQREAAVARGGSLTKGDRPQNRSSFGDTVDKHVRAPKAWEFRAAPDPSAASTFEGYASMTEQPYDMFDFFGPYSEIVSLGAFEATLAAEPDVPLVLQHNSMQRIASTANGTLQLSEDDTGLLSVAQLDPTDLDVQYIVPKLQSGLINEMSFRFNITSSQWSPDYTELRINAVNIDRGDVSIVGFGANPYTSAGVRSRSLEEYLRDASVEELETAKTRIPHLLRDRAPKTVIDLAAPAATSKARLEIAAALAAL